MMLFRNLTSVLRSTTVKWMATL